MRVPVSWLRDFAPIEGSDRELATALDDLGLVVEGIERVGEGLDEVVVARVLATRPHPGADKVQLVDVDAGDGEALQVVCGAFNFSPGDLVPLATVGATIPNGLTISRRKVRGEWSNGMLCSTSELGLGDDHSGIMVLSPGAPLGVPVAEALGIGADTVFDLDVSPNRPDAMSVAGVARDLAAKLGVPFALPEPAAVTGTGSPSSLEVDARDLCPRFTATVLSGVQAGAAPEWMAARLTLAGMRPISAVVDVSNYVMLELGHPNHPYDMTRLGGGGLRIRRARPGEVVVTLDDVARTMGPDDCLICDANDEPVGIGGIMGGAAAEIAATTSTVLLEMAYFDPMTIARTSKRIGLRTEASARFERGVDPWTIDRSVARFCELLAEITASSATTGTLDVRGELPPRPRIELRTARVNAVLGTLLDDGDVRGYLEPIGFECEPAGPGAHQVTVPSWRPDSEREIDVIEEVGRHHGFGEIRRTLPAITSVGLLTRYQRDRRHVRQVLAGAGLSEAWSSSLLAPADLEAAGLGREAVRLENPLAKEESVLRTSILPGLLRALGTNAAHRNPDVALFEIGAVFRPPSQGDLPDEREHLAAALAGRDATAARHLWDVLAGALRLDRDVVIEAAEAPGLHPTRTARVVAGGEELGVLGEVDPGVVAAHGLEGRVAWLQMDLARLLGAPRRSAEYQPVSRYPSADFDLDFAVDEGIAAGAVERTLRDAAGNLLAGLWLFDVFRSPTIGEGRRSLTWRIRVNALDRTLTDADVGEVRRRCIDAVKAAHAAELRG